MARTALVAALLGTAILLPTHSADASGFASAAVGPTQTDAATPHPAATYHNPALLGWVDRPRLVLGGRLFLGRLKYRRERRADYQYEDSFDFALPIDSSSLDPEKRGEAAPVNPAIRIVPCFTGSSPNTARNSSVRPAPTSPAIPSTSPRCRVNEARVGLGSPARSASSRIASPGVRSLRG